MEKGGSGVGSGSISQRYGSGDPHQNVTNPSHCFFVGRMSRLHHQSPPSRISGPLPLHREKKDQKKGGGEKLSQCWLKFEKRR
jgi:hypothetical protein